MINAKGICDYVPSLYKVKAVNFLASVSIIHYNTRLKKTRARKMVISTKVNTHLWIGWGVDLSKTD